MQPQIYVIALMSFHEQQCLVARSRIAFLCVREVQSVYHFLSGSRSVVLSIDYPSAFTRIPMRHLSYVFIGATDEMNSIPSLAVAHRIGVNQLVETADEAWGQVADAHRSECIQQRYLQYQAMGGITLTGFKVFVEQPGSATGIIKEMHSRHNTAGQPWGKAVRYAVGMGLDVSTAFQPPVENCIVESATRIGARMLQERMAGSSSPKSPLGKSVLTNAVPLALQSIDFSPLFTTSTSAFSKYLTQTTTETARNVIGSAAPGDHSVILCAADILTGLSFTPHLSILVRDLTRRTIRSVQAARLVSLCDCMSDEGIADRDREALVASTNEVLAEHLHKPFTMDSLRSGSSLLGDALYTRYTEESDLISAFISDLKRSMATGYPNVLDIKLRRIDADCKTDSATAVHDLEILVEMIDRVRIPFIETCQVGRKTDRFRVSFDDVAAMTRLPGTDECPTPRVLESICIDSLGLSIDDLREHHDHSIRLLLSSRIGSQRYRQAVVPTLSRAVSRNFPGEMSR
jgi:hypothetical protein